MSINTFDAAKEHYSTGNYEGALKLYLSMKNHLKIQIKSVL